MPTESTEREMVRRLRDEPEPGTPAPERPFTSLQPTYEDTIAPGFEDEWSDD